MVSCSYNHTVFWFFNITGQDMDQPFQKKDVVLFSVSISLSIVIILANALVIMAIIVRRHFHQPFFYLLASLASADLFSGITFLYVLLSSGVNRLKLTISQWFMRQLLFDISLISSLVNLVVIAIERHHAVFQTHKESNRILMSNFHVAILIVFTWSISIFIGLFPELGWNCLCEPSTCSRLFPLYARSYLVFLALLNMIILCIMILVYVHIFYYIWRKMQLLSQPAFQPTKSDMIQLMKTAFCILSAFVICWTPGLVVLLLDGVGCMSCDVLKVEKYFLLLAELNSLFNPLIYSFRDNEMRQTFKHILCLPWKRNTSFTTSSTRAHILMHKVPSPDATGSEPRGVNSSV